jgi:hypothetical protein
VTIRYLSKDRDAEAIAARLAALANAEAPLPWLAPFRGTRVRAISSRDLDRILEAGALDGIVIAPHGLLPDPCPGDQPPPGGSPAAAAPPAVNLIPLMDTRAHLVIRRTVGGVAIDGAGAILLARAVRGPAS